MRNPGLRGRGRGPYTKEESGILVRSEKRSLSRRNDRGATLLISIAILALLSLFSLAFVRLIRFEREASSNYSQDIRAQLLARAGIGRTLYLAWI